MASVETSRRHFLQLLPMLASFGVAAGCKRESPEFSCTDTTGLAQEDLQARIDLAYVEHSPHPGKDCSTCQQYVPSSYESACGTCKIMKGPVHPRGYCKVFAAKT